MEVNQQNPGGENASITAETPIQQGDSVAAGVASATGEPAAATEQASSEQTMEPSSDVGATSGDAGQPDSSTESTGESQTGVGAGSTADPVPSSAIAKLRAHLWSFEREAVAELHAALDEIETFFA